MFRHSHQWFLSAQTLKSNSHAEYMFIVLISCSDLLKHWRATHLLDVCLANLISSFDLLKYLRVNPLAECMFSHSYQWV
jgi:hypothetical protein